MMSPNFKLFKITNQSLSDPGAQWYKHSTHNPKIKGLNPATGTWREKMRKETSQEIFYTKNVDF
jgi:hypothetical protein